MEWISIKDQLPPDMSIVKVMAKAPWEQEAVYYEVLGKFYQTMGDSVTLLSIPHVTHWMPLPEKPK